MHTAASGAREEEESQHWRGKEGEGISDWAVSRTGQWRRERTRSGRERLDKRGRVYMLGEAVAVAAQTQAQLAAMEDRDLHADNNKVG